MKENNVTERENYAPNETSVIYFVQSDWFFLDLMFDTV